MMRPHDRGTASEEGALSQSNGKTGDALWRDHNFSSNLLPVQ